MKKKIVSFMLITAMCSSLFCSTVSAVTMYAPDGRTANVSYPDIQAWKNVGWYDVPVTTMYAPDGRTAVVAKTDVQAWKNVGWFSTVTMYAPDGRTANVSYPDIQAWKNVGWYDVPVTTMHAPDGRTAVVAKTDVQAWKNVGWYENPVIISSNGTIYNISYPKNASIYSDLYGVMQIHSFQINDILDYRYNSGKINLNFTLVGTVYGDDGFKIHINCYNASNVLIDSIYIYKYVPFNNQFQMSDSIVIPKDTNRISFSQ